MKWIFSSNDRNYPVNLDACLAVNGEPRDRIYFVIGNDTPLEWEYPNHAAKEEDLAMIHKAMRAPQ